MATIATIQSTDVIATSRADINGNFSALNADKQESSALDNDSTLGGASASATKYPSQLATKLYVDTGGNVNASETSKGIVEEATDAEVTAGTATGATGAKLIVTPAKLATRLSSLVKFGGTGADGALAITTGATNIDCANAAVVIKNYTSISITGTGSLTFTNPHANGTTIVLKSQGNVTLTSSAAPMIVASGMGGAGGAISSPDGVQDGKNGTGSYVSAYYTAPGLKATAGSGGAGGAKGVWGINTANMTAVGNKNLLLMAGAGGGSGNGLAGGHGASAGNGGAGLVIECGGAWNFTTASGISVAGQNGGGVAYTSGGGGGGGGAGVCFVYYNSLTANSGTITVSGGTGSVGTSAGGGMAGGGGGSIINAGGAGADGANAQGGNGGAGYSFVALNTEIS